MAWRLGLVFQRSHDSSHAVFLGSSYDDSDLHEDADAAAVEEEDDGLSDE